MWGVGQYVIGRMLGVKAGPSATYAGRIDSLQLAIAGPLSGITDTLPVGTVRGCDDGQDVASAVPTKAQCETRGIAKWDMRRPVGMG